MIKDGNDQYYLLKMVRHGFDVYCIPPYLGVHYSLHESGESHFRREEKPVKSRYESPVALVMGEAGRPSNKGIICAPLSDLGRAAGICSAVFSIDSLSQDFQTFNRSGVECFVIDKDLFSRDIKLIETGVWAVPARNKVSFEFNNPDIPENLLYRITSCEPQIWLYARPC